MTSLYVLVVLLYRMSRQACWRAACAAQQGCCPMLASQRAKIAQLCMLCRDFQPNVISAVQAFAVALSTFDTKVLL